jgi:outer membrane biosynthesis protein TonB
MRHSISPPGSVRRSAWLALAMALAGCGKLTDAVTTPSNGPVIQRFLATPNPVDPGSVVLLTWEVAGVGTVTAKGSRVVAPGRTTTYKLNARSGTSSAYASVDVVVVGTSPSPSPKPSTLPSPEPSPSPSPNPSPSPSPEPSPSSSPSPSPSPSASPSPGASPSPSPSPAVTCGTQATFPGHCHLTISYPDKLPASQCIELTDIRTSADCPVNFGVPLSLSFQITAEMAADYTWRRQANSADVVTPASGTVAKSGVTNVTVSDLVLGDRVTIEVVRGGNMVLAFTLKH